MKSIVIRIEEKDKQLLSDAAHKDKKSLAAWMRFVLVETAKLNLGVK